MPKLTLHYMITNGGDGSASANFYADEKTCQLACDMEEEAGEAFCETWPSKREFFFDAHGKLLNPDETKEELLRELAEMRGEETEEGAPAPAPAFSKAAARPGFDGAVYTGEIWYVVRNCGDGSAAVSFYGDEESAQLRADIEEEGGEPFCEHGPHCQQFSFDAKGRLLNPDNDYAGLKRERAERLGEEAPEEKPQAPAKKKSGGRFDM